MLFRDIEQLTSHHRLAVTISVGDNATIKIENIFFKCKPLPKKIAFWGNQMIDIPNSCDAFWNAADLFVATIIF
jgi:hypothetical protein